ncbi:uncharacterized protein [Periplaneta americana]|uniref:uncharacterized protein n=1 Tax=Periplaneta americana TaxID=6978 RepID=UPI0037E74BE4
MNSAVKRENTLKAIFIKEETRPKAFDIHRWIEEGLRIKDTEIQAIQLVGKQNAVYIKLTNKIIYEHYLQQHTGSSSVKLMNGDNVTVNITPADEEVVMVRVLNIPPEVSNERIRHVLQNYGKVQHIENEKWSSKFRYTVYTGIRITHMVLNKVIPSSIVIAGHEAYVTYPGQELTCFSCGSTAHIRQACPNRNIKAPVTVQSRTRLTLSDLIPSPSVSKAARTPTMTSVSSENGTDSLSEKQASIGTSDTKLMHESTSLQNKSITQKSSVVTDKTVTMTIEQGDSETDSADDVSEIRHEQPVKKYKAMESSDTGECSANEQKNPVDVVVPVTTDDSKDPEEIRGATAAVPEDWNEAIQQEEQDPGSTNKSSSQEIGVKKLAKSSNSPKHRSHPYKGEGSKLGFPLLRPVD